MKQNKQKGGFTLVEALVVVLVVAVIAFAGWWVWKMQHDKDKKASSTHTSQTSKEDSSVRSSNGANQAPATNYLTIKEWGVRVKLPDQLATAYYATRPDTSDAVYVSLEKFKGTGCAADEVGLGAFARSSHPNDVDPAIDMKIVDAFPKGVQIGNYYYYAVHPQATCSDNKETQTETAALSKAFVETGTTFEVAP